MNKKIAAIVFYLVLIMPFTMQVAFAEDWPMFHHDLALNGYTISNAPNTNNIAWTFLTGGPVKSSPAVVNGKVYIGSLDGNLYCLDKYTGALAWMFPTGSAIYSSPAVSDGRVYFLSTNGIIYALNASDGAIVWSVAIGPGGWNWSSPAVHNGRVFIGAGTGWIYCMDANTGAPVWQTFAGSSPNGPVTVANGKVYSGTHNFDNSSPTLVALDELTGIPVWTYSYTNWHPNSVAFINSNGVAVADGDGDGDLEVYFGVVTWYGFGDQAIALDEATGNEVWTHNINGWSTSTPAVHNGKIFIGSDDGRLYSLDASDGSEVWSYLTGGPVWSAPAVSGDGKVCFGSLDHTVYCLNEATGGLFWSYFTGASRLESSPAISDSMLFVGNENGKVYAFGPITIKIDIKPESFPNSINRKSKGNVPVAILGSETFDATSVDRSTVEFAGAIALTIGGCPNDVNNDGFADIVLHFSTRELNLQTGDTEACLTGMTSGGQEFRGCDSVRIIK